MADAKAGLREWHAGEFKEQEKGLIDVGRRDSLLTLQQARIRNLELF
jgi:hypothetical protein